MDKKTVEDMKKIILLIMMCCIQFCIYAQDIDSLIDIKGYYVTIFSKQEIIFSYEQKIKKEMGLFFATPIDYKQSSFFIPVQVGNKIICEKEMVATKILNSVQNDSIYYVIPHRHYNDLLKKMDIITMDISKETCIFSEYRNLSPYYEVSGHNKFLFKCIYIEGGIHNTGDNPHVLLLPEGPSGQQSYSNQPGGYGGGGESLLSLRGGTGTAIHPALQVQWKGVG